MKNNISKICLLTLLAFSATANAQNSLTDKDSVRVDLGFGQQQKLSYSTAAVTIITGDELKQTAAINLSDALYGRLLGLSAFKTGGFSGDDGYGSWFNIRGNQTTSENNVLVLVDGIKRSIDRLTVDEVESVTVLKDAAAVALLGYKGVNGALLVKTKRGKEEKIGIDVSYNHKFTFSPKVADFVDAHTYASAMNEARLNDGFTTPAYSDVELDLFKDGSDPYFYPNVNWKKEVLKDIGSENMLNVAVHGGSDKVKFYTMLDYTTSSGLLKGADAGDFNTQLRYSKANVRANLDFAITSTTNMEVNVLANFIETNEPSAGNGDDIFYRIYQLPASAFPINTPDNVWGGNQYYGDANPVACIQSSGREKSHQRALYADARLTQDLGFWVKGLSASARLGYDNYSRINEDHNSSFQYGYLMYNGAIGDKDNVQTVLYGDKVNSINYSKELTNQWRSSFFALSVDYNRTFGDHALAASAIYNTESEVGMGRYNTFYRANVMGYLNYIWKQKLAANLVLAGNGSNRSYPEKWSFSPTMSLAYIFVNNVENKVLDYGKVRASFGIQHSDYVPINGIWLENYSGSHGNFVFGTNYDGGFWGSYLAYYPLSSFNLETAYKYNLGVDLRLFRSLDVTVDAYYNRRSNIMLSANDLNSWVAGRPDSYATKGIVDSYGVELGLNYAKQLSKDFLLNAGASFTWGTNEIKEFIENPSEEYQSRIGQRVDQVYGLEAIGFFKDQQDIDNSPAQLFSQVRPGDIKYKDQNGDGTINEDDEIYFGYGQNIPEVNYSFSLGVKYKRVGFNLLFQGVSGLTKYLGTVGVWDCMKGNNNLSKHYLQNAWRPNSDNAGVIYPRLTSQDNPNNYRANNVWYNNINWLKLRNVEVYYLLPETWAHKMRISQAKLYVKGENLLTFSNMNVMDPEVLGTNYPVLKGISAGIVVNF